MAYYLVIMERNKYVRDIEYKASKTVEANNPIEAQEIAENIANENLSDEEISNHGKYIAISIEYIFNPQGETLSRFSHRNCTNNASF
ncbi:TPA: hypothetical protein OZ525_004636 [Escherichia coli]|nr:hypothetical protein [Escherichia coli]EFC6241886.1 hypothetical protein [Escherichia coli]EFO4547466.1 hypothetical protein [Escherichia coli]HCX7341645.1 hypothetical protein [Escherichia coli]